MAFQIEKLWEECEQFFKRPRKPSTIEKYEQVCKLGNQMNLAAPEYLSWVAKTKPGQFVLTKSALVYALWTQVYQHIRAALRCKKAGLIAEGGQHIWGAANAEANIKLLKEQDPPKHAFKRKGKSKRGTLKSLPADWQEQLVQHTPAYALPAVLVACLSGCRPAELEKGVEVKLEGTNSLTITIQGAKLTDKTGQPERTLTFDVIGLPLVERLAELVKQAGGALRVQKNKRTLNDNLATASKAAKLPAISAYTCRHYLASQLKHLWNDDKVAIAMVLGHVSTASQKHYGSRQQGRRGSLALVAVEASRPVRTPHRPHFTKTRIVDASMDLPTPSPFY